MDNLLAKVKERCVSVSRGFPYVSDDSKRTSSSSKVNSEVGPASNSPVPSMKSRSRFASKNTSSCCMNLLVLVY